MKTYTRDELTAKLVGMIEPMPSQPSIYYTVSPMGLWVYVSRQWIPARTIKPLDNIGDTIRCVEAKYGPGCWIKQTVAFPAEPGYYQQMRVSSYAPYEYFDNDHALALALALASAVDGERAEAVG
jgi:hypothetical protein